MPAELRYLHQSQASSVATFREVSIFVVHRDVTVEALRASITACHEIKAHYPGAVLSVTLAAPGARVPSAEARHEATLAMRATQDHSRCAAVVLAGEGFWFSAMRSALTAIDLMRPYPVPRRVFARVPPAVQWMATFRDKATPGWVDEVVAAIGRTFEGG